MIHPSDEEPAKTLPNGWVTLEPGDFVPEERMYRYRKPDSMWTYTRAEVIPRRNRYDPPAHRSLARRVAVAEREWQYAL